MLYPQLVRHLALNEALLLSHVAYCFRFGAGLVSHASEVSAVKARVGVRNKLDFAIRLRQSVVTSTTDENIVVNG